MGAVLGGGVYLTKAMLIAQCVSTLDLESLKSPESVLFQLRPPDYWFSLVATTATGKTMESIGFQLNVYERGDKAEMFSFCAATEKEMVLEMERCSRRRRRSGFVDF